MTERVPSLAAARFFVDEDLSGLGIALMRLRHDVIVGRRAPVIDVVPKDDPDWIPIVAACGWVVITNDRRIRTRPGEADQARDTGLRCVCLRPAVRDATPWDFMVVLARHWARVEEFAGCQGPAWLELRGDRARELRYQPGLLASASADRTVRLWDPATGHPLHMIPVHYEALELASFEEGCLVVGLSAGLLTLRVTTWSLER